MTPRSLRSKAFILVLTVLHSRVTAFTIRRASDSTNHPDLKAAESKLTVKNGLTQINPYPIQSDNVPAESAQSDITQDAATTKGISSTTVETTPAVTTVSTTNPTAQTTTSHSQQTETAGKQATETSSATETANEITSYDKTPTPSVELKTTNVNAVLTAFGNNSAINTTDNITATIKKEIAVVPVPPKDIIAEPKTEVGNISYSTEPVNKGINISDISSTKGIDGNRRNEITTTTQLTTSTLSTSSGTEQEESNSSTIVPSTLITESNATETVAEELTGADSAATVTPYWKKYTVIDRKRTTPQLNLFTSTDHELIKSGTAQTASFQKAMNIPSSGIPSLDQLSNELLSLSKGTTISLEKTDFTPSVELSTTLAKSSEKTTAVSAEDNVDYVTKLEIVTSKRAGFLDYSVRPTLGTEPAVVKKEETLLQVTQNNEAATTIETTSKTDDGLKRSSMASQSQLAEDAIKEELMKEETLSNYKDVERQRQDNLVVKAKEKQSVDLPVADPSSEDKLSVKPISTKPQRLYTVSPNYKPLKKLDIQPPKPYVRNPDDNSWRNESLSSLGIVFKANNSSKPFTEVLKNKTETELNSTLSTYSKDDTPELRERLEKIAEQRKSKKKKTNQLGETVYTDYEESISAESPSATKIPETTPVVFAPITPPKELSVPPTSPPADSLTTLFNFDFFKTDLDETTTIKAKKLLDEYETDEEEPDYTLANIDLKKFITPPRNLETLAPAPRVIELAKPPTTRTYLPERKPTIQYFPPREKQKVVIQDYDTDFQRKINAYTYKDNPTKVTQTVAHTVSTQATLRFPKNKFESPQRPNDIVKHSQDLNKNLYLSNSVPADLERSYLVPTDAAYHRGSYVIKHLRDFIDEVVKVDENLNLGVTDAPIQGVTTNVGLRENSVRPPADYYDYEAQFKKEVIDRFVDNFNQNSDRFKADFPVLYNTTVVHSNLSDASRQASSSAFMKRLYENARAIQSPKQYEPPCDRTVELSPAYELHYYVPEEEEKEVYQPKPVSVIPYRFRL